METTQNPREAASERFRSRFLADEAAYKEKLAELYETELADPFNAAKGGYLDDIIEPQFAKQYLVAALQTVVR